MTQSLRVIRAISLGAIAGASGLARGSEPGTDTAKAYEAELVADAGDRASFADGGSGWQNGKFTLTDGGPNVMNIGGFLQARYMGNFRDRAAGEAEYAGGFQIQRARLKLDGSVWDKALTYNVLTELAGSSAVLLDAEARYTFENKVYIRAGQFKPLFNREELVSDIYQLTVERSITNAVFTMTRSQGVGAGWQNDDFRVGVDVTDGTSALNTPFDAAKESDYAITARAEWKWAGKDFKRFNDFTSWRGDDYAGLLGAAIDYEASGDTFGTLADRKLLKATVDVSIEGKGWNAFVAALYQNINPATGVTTDDWGFVAQAGVFITDQIEVFGRYDLIIPDDANGPDDFNTVTAGVNYYVSPRSHAFKLTGDVVYYIDAEADAAIVPAPSTSANLLTDPKGDQVAFRLQAQVIF